MPLKVSAWLTTDGKLFMGEGEATRHEADGIHEEWNKFLLRISGAFFRKTVSDTLWAHRAEIVEILAKAPIDKAPGPGVQNASPPNWMADCLKKDG